MIKHIITSIVILAFMSGCESEECCEFPTADYNYSFDIRQCGTDNFAEAVKEDDSLENRINDMHRWLDEQDLDIEKVELTVNFHEAVCEACDICPQGDRYFISSYDTIYPFKVKDLNLLNFEPN